MGEAVSDNRKLFFFPATAQTTGSGRVHRKETNTMAEAPHRPTTIRPPLRAYDVVVRKPKEGDQGGRRGDTEEDRARNAVLGAFFAFWENRSLGMSENAGQSHYGAGREVASVPEGGGEAGGRAHRRRERERERRENAPAPFSPLPPF